MADSSDFPPDATHPPAHPPLPARRLIVPLALFVFAGTPLVALVWDALNRLTAGLHDLPLLAAGLVALVLLIPLLRLLARTVTGWESHRFD